MISRPPFRYHGAKFRMAPWIISFFPEHDRYVEPFGGSAAVLLNKPRSGHEVYNDLDLAVWDTMDTLSSHRNVAWLVDRLHKLPYHRKTFEQAFEFDFNDISADQRERALWFIVRACMGFSSDSASRPGKTGFRTHADAVATFSRGFEHLHEISHRLNGVLFECKPALDVIQQYDDESALFYVDPPYVLGSRNNASGGYRHEMTDDDHIELVDSLLHVEGMVILSGYDNAIYQPLLEAGWKQFACDVLAQSNAGSVKRKELLWISPAAQRGNRQGNLFAEVAA